MVSLSSNAYYMKKKIFIHSILFVLGFSIIFAIFGVLIQYFFLSYSYKIQEILRYVGGGIITLFGILILSGAVFFKERHIQFQKSKYAYLNSFLFGVAFAAGWSPCVGAIMGAILTMAAIQPVHAGGLMLAYSMGIGVPFLLFGLLAETAKKHLKRIHPYLHTLHIFFGGLLVLIGALILTNTLGYLGTWETTAELFFRMDAFLGNTGVNYAIAFLAGVGSFLSPCIFPLLPAYIAYLGTLSTQKS